MLLMWAKNDLELQKTQKLEQQVILDSQKVMLSLIPDKKTFHASSGHSSIKTQKTNHKILTNSPVDNIRGSTRINHNIIQLKRTETQSIMIHHLHK